MSKDESLEVTLRLLQEASLAPIAHEAVRDYLSWDELVERPLSAGISAAEAWKLLAVLRRFDATWFPIPTLAGERFWYALPREAVRCLQEIEHHCRADSLLHKTVEDREGHRFLVRSRVREAIATCELDGIQIDYERAGRMLQEGRAPQTPEDRLVLNSYQMLEDIEGLAQEPLSPTVGSQLYSRLTEGVDVAGLRRGPVTTNLAATRNPDGLMSDRDLESVFQTICDYANGDVGDPLEPVAAKGYMLLSAMAYWHPLPDFNGSVARHMLRIFAVRRDYPVLGYLPMSQVRHRWVQGQLDSGVVRYQHIDRRPAIEGEIEGTADLLTSLQIVVVAIHDVLRLIEKSRLEDRAVQEALDADTELNYRQRSVLARAMTRPSAEFQIRQHQHAHRVVYSTARADLFELADLGYLRKEIRGKAFIFVPEENLRERLAGAVDQLT